MLAFTSVYFSETSLFNGLQAIQIKKSVRVPNPVSLTTDCEMFRLLAFTFSPRRAASSRGLSR
jgi:hypothetical protein